MNATAGTSTTAADQAGSRRSLAAVGVTVQYGRHPVLRDVHLRVHPGQTLGLRGPSGSGKTTLLRVLALLTAPRTGHVELDGTRLHGTRHTVPATTRRRIAVLFQSPRAASDPRLTLHDLIAEPLRTDDLTTDADVRTTVAELADRVGLTTELLTRRPHAVSDGQLQRACLARALAQRPDYLLADEATTMLDASTQAQLVTTIRDHQAATGLGVLTVSHDDTLLARWADTVHDLTPHGIHAPGDPRAPGTRP